MKVHQTDPGIPQQKDQEHRHQQKRPPQHQEDHGQSKEVEINNDDHRPRLTAPDHQPNKWKLNLQQHPKRNKCKKDGRNKKTQKENQKDYNQNCIK
jgi:hypothetical protein